MMGNNMENFIFGAAAEAADAEDSSAVARTELQKIIEEKTAEFIAGGGIVTKLGITKAVTHQPIWDSSSSSEDKKTVDINKRIINEYATANSPAAFAKELGLTIAALRRRAGRLKVARTTTQKESE